MNPWIIIGVITAIILAGVGGEFHGRSVERTTWKAKIEEARAEAAESAIRTERETQKEVNNALQKQNAELNTINDNLSAELVSLRKRPPRRVPGTPTANCEGATGAELSREDAGAFAREAARADKLRAALRTCYEYADTIERLMSNRAVRR